MKRDVYWKTIIETSVKGLIMQAFIQTFGKYILMVIVAALSFLGGSVTDIGQAVQVAIDKDKALAQAVVIINATPETDIVDAVKDEPNVSAKDAVDANATVEEIVQ